jgi:hypothetical protein
MSDRDTLFSAPIASLGDWTFDERATGSPTLNENSTARSSPELTEK